MKKLYRIICSKYRTFERPKISYLLEKKHYAFLLFAVSARMRMKSYLKKENQLWQ